MKPTDAEDICGGCIWKAIHLKQQLLPLLFTSLFSKDFPISSEIPSHREMNAPQHVITPKLHNLKEQKTTRKTEKKATSKSKALKLTFWNKKTSQKILKENEQGCIREKI